MRLFIVLTEEDILKLQSGNEVTCPIGNTNYISISKRQYKERFLKKKEENFALWGERKDVKLSGKCD